MKRLLKISLLLVLLFGLVPARANTFGTLIFKLSVSGKSTQTDVILNPGVKPIQGVVNDKTVSDTLTGVLDDFAAQYLPVDAGGDGHFYLYYDTISNGPASWRVAANPNGQDTTTLTGQIDNIGNFIMFGTYNFVFDQQTALPNIALCAVGKATLTKGTYIPTAVKGTIYMSSTIAGELLTLKFKTVGGPL
ncbi:MAG: hypothetical protein ACKVS6_16440 [Planctomycetota bacterium]